MLQLTAKEVELIKGALQDSQATLLRWSEHFPDIWDSRDELTYKNVEKAFARLTLVETQHKFNNP